MYLARLLHLRRAINLLHLTSAKKTVIPCKDFKVVCASKHAQNLHNNLPLKIYYNVKVPKIMLNHREMGYWSSVSPFAFTLRSHSPSQLVILSNVNWHPVMMKKRKQITEYWTLIKELPSSSSSAATAMEISQKLIEKQLESQHKNGVLKERTEREQLKTFLCCSTAIACA